jgi:hypothetical protein
MTEQEALQIVERVARDGHASDTSGAQLDRALATLVLANRIHMQQLKGRLNVIGPVVQAELGIVPDSEGQT